MWRTIKLPKAGEVSMVRDRLESRMYRDNELDPFSSSIPFTKPTIHSRDSLDL